MNECFLLRYTWQTEQFRECFADFIGKYAEKYREWFQGLPLYEWVRIPWTGKLLEPSIKILCLLYIEGKINVTFDRTVTMVQRGALSEEEYQEWAAKYFKNYTKK